MLANLRHLWLDRALDRAIDARARRALARIGAYIRTTARTSLGPPNKTAPPRPPGKPPRTRVADPANLRAIEFALLPGRHLVVGPIRFTRQSQPAPAVHEHGLTATLYRKKRTKAPPILSWTGPGRAVTVRFPKRPFMRPALEKTLQRLPRLLHRFLER